MSILFSVPTVTATTVPSKGGTFHTGFTTWNPATATSTAVTTKTASTSRSVKLPKSDVSSKIPSQTTLPLLVPLRASTTSSKLTSTWCSLLASTTTLSLLGLSELTFTRFQAASSTASTASTVISETLRIFRSWSLKTFATWPCSRTWGQPWLLKPSTTKPTQRQTTL